MQITINRDGQNYGPYTVEQLQQMLQAGRAQLTDLANYEGAAEWVPLSQIPGVTQAQSTPVTAPIDADTYVPTGQHEHEFRIECKPDFSFLTVQVPASQTLKVEASAMATMSTNMVMKTKMKGGLSRFLGGENIFINEFTAQAGPAEIGIAPGSPGDMDHVFMDGSSEIFLQSLQHERGCGLQMAGLQRLLFRRRPVPITLHRPGRPMVQHLRRHDRSARGWQLRGRHQPRRGFHQRPGIQRGICRRPKEPVSFRRRISLPLPWPRQSVDPNPPPHGLRQLGLPVPTSAEQLDLTSLL
jgi:hypothetical protein